jgi:hypothetical protein
VIFLDTNVVSETLKRTPDPKVLRWLERHDAVLALSTVVIAELAFGIARIRPDERAQRLMDGLMAWRQRFSGCIYTFTESAAMVYGERMGAATRKGRAIAAPDGMIAAIAQVHEAALATRNISDFQAAGITIINPWTD